MKATGRALGHITAPLFCRSASSEIDVLVYSMRSLQSIILVERATLDGIVDDNR